MVNIDKELFSNISLENFLPLNNSDLEIEHLIDKYKLEKNLSFLPVHTNESKFEIVRDYIIELYLSDKVIPDDIAKIINENFDFKLFLLNDIKTRMKSIMTDTTTIVYKEIYIVINLLSLGKKYDIFKNYQNYSMKSIKELFQDYEKFLVTLSKDLNTQNFNLSFKYYIALIESFNELCIINSLDIERRKSIEGLVELLTETMNNVKFTIKLDNENLEILNNILGRMLLYFSNIQYIAITKKTIDEVVSKYEFILKRHLDGFLLLTQTEVIEKNSIYYLPLLEKTTTLILTLIFKVKSKISTQNISIDEYKDFRNIVNIYFERFNVVNVKIDTIEEFRESLLNQYLQIEEKTSVSHTHYMSIIDSFIEDKSYSTNNMSLLHNIVLFSDDIQKEKIDRILTRLIDSDRITNDYYEFFKLKIIDRILQKYINLKVEVVDNKFIPKIIKYIESNNVASHLMPMYSKIYLSLSLYYSYSKDNNFQELSKSYYFRYKSLDNNMLLDNEFKLLSKQIFLNYGKISCKKFDLEEFSLSPTKKIHIGQNIIDEYFLKKEYIKKDMLSSKVGSIIKRLYQNSHFDLNQLNSELEELISKKIFYGLVIVKISTKNYNQDVQLKDIGYKKVHIDLIDGFMLHFYYSSAYEECFQNLLKLNIDFFENSLINVMTSYIKNIAFFKDDITKLPNMNMLEKDLELYKDEEIIFVQFYIETIPLLSLKNTYDETNDYFRELAFMLNKIKLSYRMNGPRIAMIFKTDEEYNEAIDLIDNIIIEYKGKKVKAELSTGVAIGKIENIMEKSFYAVSSARLNENKFYLFD